MPTALSRRECIALLAAPAPRAARPAGVLIDTHIHLFDPKRFPYHTNAVYKPPAQTLDEYTAFVRQARIDHTIIVHPEPYQDDHSYLENCFANEPSPGFFKGTCLFDPVDPKTPARMEALVKKLPKRIVALRIHATEDPKKPRTTLGQPIRDRDLAAPQMRQTWAAAGRLGLAIQMHCIPAYAPAIGGLSGQFPRLPVVIDHLARAGQGSAAEYDDVLKLAKLPRVYMKFSAVNYSSKEGYPYRDTRTLVRRTYDAFGPDRMIWGGLGHSMGDFEKAVTVFEQSFDFATEADKAKIRGLNAAKLFGF